MATPTVCPNRQFVADMSHDNANVVSLSSVINNLDFCFTGRQMIGTMTINKFILLVYV